MSYVRSIPEPSSWPNPAQDYDEGPLDLNRVLLPRPASMFVLQVASDRLAAVGIRRGDRVVVDRAYALVPGALVVVASAGEHRIGIFRYVDQRPVIACGTETIPWTAEVEYFGTVIHSIHQHTRRREGA